MIIDLNYRVDILKGIVSQNAEHPLYYDDQNAHRVNVSLYRGQEEINLSGLSCNGYVVFVKEGASIGPLTGEVSNNTCSVVLPHEAYQHPGAIRVEIKLIEGDSVTTVLMLTGHVSSGRGDRVIDITGSIVPSLDSLKATIEELERRVAAIEVSEVVELGTKVSIISRGHGENLISLEDFTDILSGVTCVVDSENQTLTATCAKGTYCSVQTSSTWVQEHLIPGHTYRLHAKTERISGSPEIRVAFRGTQSSYATIPIGGGIYYDNNVGGDGFIDLTIDQYVKRVSLFITMGTSAAASVTFSDIWIVDVTDETVRYDATKTAILDAGCYVDWGWVPGEQTATVAGVAVTRNGNRITLNGTTTGNNQARFRMIGSLIAKSGEPTATENIAGPTMVSGHTYAVTMRLVSGTITKNAADSGTVSTVLNKSGTSSTTFESHLYSTLNENGYLYRWFVGDGNALTLWLFFGAKLTATNAVLEYALIDTTAADKTQYPAALALGASTTVGGDVPVEYYGAPGSITTSNKMGVSKLWGNRVTLNGVGSSGTYGMVTIHNGVRFLNNWNTNDNFVQIPLLEGHTYLLSARVISGTTVQVGNADSGIVYFTKVGTEEVGVPNFTLTMNADFANGIRVWTRRYTAAANTLIGFGFYFRQMTATNLVIEFNAKDITACVDGAGNIAQQDTKTAGNQHAAGDLLTVGGTLYKATQAIAPGETINPGTNVTATTVAAQLAERDTAIAAVEADAEDIFMEPWQLVAKKYFLPDSAGNLTVRRNHITYRPSASQSSPAVRSLIGAYEGANTTLGNYTPTIDQLIPVSVFGDAIKIGFYLDAAGTDRYPRFAYKFCTVDGETVTPISGAQGSLPATSATGVLAETSVTIPDGATHVFFGLLYSNGYKENATYDMVYKVDKG